jgi:enoyl-CoA hydratase/carnithine racemase
MRMVGFGLVDCYAQITLQDEGKFNPLSLQQFGEAIDQCLSSTQARALILTGSGKNFSQGLDLESMSRMDAKASGAFVDECMATLTRLLVFPVPVVTAVNGHAFGFGAMLVLASDYSVMREDRGFFCLPEIDLGMGLIPSMNALVTHKLTGRVLRNLLLTGKRVGGREALEYGIVDACSTEHELLAKARSLPLPMMGKDKKALVQLKTGMNGEVLRHCRNTAHSENQLQIG